MSIFDRTKKMIGKLGVNEQEEIKTTSSSPDKPISNIEKKKINRSYIRNRGKGGSKPMSYYLPEWLIKALHEKSIKDNISKSDLVVEGLKYVLRDEIKEMKARGEF